MAKIADHLRIEELEERFRAATDTVEARHVQAIWLLAKGRTCVEVADLLAFAPRWVELLAARYNAEGPDALGDLRRRNGRAATILTQAVLATLAKRLQEPPDDGGLWTGPKAAAVMAAHLGVAKVHPQRGWDALRKLNWSIQVPRPRHPAAATEEEREAFKKNSPRSLPRRRRPIRTSRSKSGRPTSTASA